MSTGDSLTPRRPAASRRRLRTAVILAVVLVAIVALTIVLATLTAPDDDPSTAPAAPQPTAIIGDQQARDVAEVVTRSMFEIDPATGDEQIATFKDNTCGEFRTQALPNLITFTDQFRAQNRSSTVTFESVAVTPHAPGAPSAEVLVAASWDDGATVNQSRIVYEVIVQNEKTCITKAQFL